MDQEYNRDVDQTRCKVSQPSNNYGTTIIEADKNGEASMGDNMVSETIHSVEAFKLLERLCQGSTIDSLRTALDSIDSVVL